jgi:lysine biosynthesis protein LysW
MPIGTCPECECEIRLGEDLDHDDIVECEECGAPLDVVGCDPVQGKCYEGNSTSGVSALNC